MSRIKLTLPDAKTMMGRLVEICDESHWIERFYPMLTKAGGRQLLPMGVGIMIAQAIHDYNEMVPGAHVAINLVLDELVAALVEDEDAAAIALSIVTGGKSGR